MYKRIIGVVLIVSILCASHTAVFGHNTMLSISYDSCRPSTTSAVGHWETIAEDGENEWWYDLVYIETNEARHIGTEFQTVKYYFADSSNGYYWDTDVTAEKAKEIKEAYANSMKQWNNVYYYSYDDNGKRTTHKIINIEEGSANDFNIRIYPSSTIDAVANCGPLHSADYPNNCTLNEEVNGIYHRHYDKWQMNVNVLEFVGELENDIQARTGVHEMGHVLGLFDVDEECDHVLPNDNHHDELLMGYGSNPKLYATYKDIAGVSITRGFHTDADHVWMLRENKNDDGTHKSFDVICALCNGVRFAVDQEITESDGNYWYSEQQIELFGSCEGEHDITGENMLLVATDGIRDFYKCLYCRYIEEVEHVHVLGEWEKVDHYTHNSTCVDCYQVVAEESHNLPENWMYKDGSNHKKNCLDCNGEILEAHIVRISEVVNGRAPCIHCGWFINVGDFSGVIHQMPKVSLNGSYVMPNGIIVLVDEDVEAYLNGTLVFYDKDKLPETE